MQGGTADSVIRFVCYSSLTESIFLSRTFFVTSLTGNINNSYLERGCSYVINQAMAMLYYEITDLYDLVKD